MGRPRNGVYVAAAIYSAIVSPDAEQTVAQDLGANEGTFGLIVAGFMVICVAPFAEEFFFRGFFYRALRSRYSVLVAALIDGLLFGIIHFDFSGPTPCSSCRRWHCSGSCSASSSRRRGRCGR